MVSVVTRRVLITKSCTIRIEANLPANLWLEIVKAAGYISNRSPVRKLKWKTPFEAVTQTKPRFAHMHVYGCRAYPLEHHIPKKNKLDARAHIGYLVGYDSTNIYRIWIPSRKKVIRTRDVTMNNNLLYDPTDLDISTLLKEQADQLIETLELPEMQIIEDNESEDLFDTFITEVPALPNLPAAPRNRASRGNEISGDLNTENIIEGSRNRISSRRSAYTTALGKNEELSGYNTSFCTASKVVITKSLHRDALPPAPKSWKQMLRHLYSAEFKKAADKEFDALLKKGTFEYIDKSKVDNNTPLLPLMWVFTYKFD